MTKNRTQQAADELDELVEAVGDAMFDAALAARGPGGFDPAEPSYVRAVLLRRRARAVAGMLSYDGPCVPYAAR